MEEKKQYSALTMDRAAFILLRVKRAFKKKRMQRKEREKNAQLSASTRIDQRASCAGLEGSAGRQGGRKMPPPLLRSRTLPAIVVPGVSIIQAQIGNYNQDIIVEKKPSLSPALTSQSKPNRLVSRFHPSRVSFSASRGGNHNDDGAGGGKPATTPMDRRKSAISRLCGTGSYGPDRHADGTLLLRVPAPHVVAANAFQRIPSPSGGSTSNSTNAFYRFSRLLTTQSSSKTADGLLDDGSNVPRRLSWERRDTLNARMPRSGSIDSMVEAVWAESVAAAAAAEREMAASAAAAAVMAAKNADSKRPSLRSGSGSSSTLGLVSPSVGRRLKGQRAVNELPTFVATECNTADDNMEVALQLAPHPSSGGGSVTSAGTGLPPPGHKPSKKQAKLMQQRLERLARINIHLHALFAAVEHGHLEKARTILESTDVDVNSVNNDGLSPLDVAVLSNNRPLVKMLVSFGGKEGAQFSSADKFGSHLKHLLGEAEMRLQELGGFLEEPCVTPLNTRASFSSMLGNAYPSSAITGCAGGDNDKQALAWGRRAKMMRRLVLGFTQARPPDPPGVLAVDVTAPNSVTVRLQEPSVGACGSEFPITTKFKVQWSTRPDFQPITGEVELLDLEHPTCTIELTHGRRYYFRAACGNLKGYGNYAPCIPNSVVPSTWRDIEEKQPARFEGRLSELESLTDDIRLLRPGGCDILDSHQLFPPPSTLCSISTSTTPSTSHQTFLSAKTTLQNQHLELLHAQQQQQHIRRNKGSKKTASIKQLFTAASKFQKHLRRGIYLACILYHEDKVLLTNEDFLPVIEIDETFPSCVHTDLHWLMKVSCTWEDTKALRTDMDKHSSSAVHFRLKLLSACIQMQQALCLQDLGQLFHRPLRDTSGTCVLCAVNYVSSPKSVSVLNSRWLPLNKVAKKCVLSEEHSVAEMLMNSIQEQIQYHQVSNLQLSKGLYVSYLKLQSSVDMIQVVVPTRTPNVLPHCKIRENPHVSAEEWSYLKQHQNIDPITLAPPTDQQRTFLELVSSAIRRLLNYMDISNNNCAEFSGSDHRLYATEVVELSCGVSCIVVCPAAEHACAVPGQRELLLQRGDLLSLPIQVFEMIHLTTYQQFLVQRYSKLSCLLELDAAQASHLHREAFSNAEVAVAKERLQKLQDLQNKLNTIWRCIRWLMDAISFSRDRSDIGIPLKTVLNLDTTMATSPTTNQKTPAFLQLPPANKSNSAQQNQAASKPSGGRGSWPGPGITSISPASSTGTSRNNNTLAVSNLLHHAEFSKSEQQLSCSSVMNERDDGVCSAVSEAEAAAAAAVVLGSEQYLSACCSDSDSRKNSGSYNSDCGFSVVETEEDMGSSGGGAMVPSRSEDVLYVVGVGQSSYGADIPTSMPTHSTPSVSRIRSNTVCGQTQQSISATSSPLLGVRPMSGSGHLQQYSHTGSLLSVDTINTTNTSDSMHSLSSGDSDNGGGVLPVVSPLAKRIECLNAASTSYFPSASAQHHKLTSISSSGQLNQFNMMASSRSMSNVMKQQSHQHHAPPRPKHLNVEPFLSSSPQKQQHGSSKSSNKSLLDAHLSKSMSNINREASGEDPLRTYIKPKASAGSSTSCNSDPMFKIPLLVDQQQATSSTSIQGNRDTTSPMALSTVATASRASTSSSTAGSSNAPSSGILQVYAAYDTGLASGTSLKLHVTPRTTAREVVDLVVKQLNMAVVLKGRDGPIYTQDRLGHFCLVAVIGARERCLRDDFRPLQLQNPWRKGRLYVRQKHDVLAALEHSTKYYPGGNGDGTTADWGSKLQPSPQRSAYNCKTNANS